MKKKLVNLGMILFSVLILNSCSYYSPQNESEFKEWVVGEWTGETESIDGGNTFWRKYVFNSDGTYLLFSAVINNRNYGNDSELARDVNNIIQEDNDNENWEILNHNSNGKWTVGKNNFSKTGEEYYFVLLKQNGESGSFSSLYPKKRLILDKGDLVVNYGLIGQYELEKGDNSPF